MRELTEFMSLVSDETTRVAEIQEEKKKRFEPRVSAGEALSEFFNLIAEAPRITETQKTTDENPKETVQELSFKDVETASVSVEMNQEENEERVDVLKTFFERLDSFETALEKNDRQAFANKMSKYIQEQPTEMSELETIKRDFRIFKEMVTRQMQSIGGGGAVNLLDLDDIDTSSLGNGKFLVYNSTTGKLEFTDQVDGN